VAQVTVRYKRLETTGPFCNVEIEAMATLDGVGDEDQYIGNAVGRLRRKLEVEVNQAVEHARRQKDIEEAEHRPPWDDAEDDEEPF